jgi:gamma-glutamylputrescine oxidase
MILQNWWYTSLLEVGRPMQPPLDSDLKADVLIIGGGAAGLAAALRLMGTGLKVVLLERNICGGGSTGKSAGFLTPDSELELAQLLRRFGPKGAKDLWEAATKGVELMTGAARKHGVQCDLVQQDSLFLGIGRGGGKAIEEEADARKALGYAYETYSRNVASAVVGSQDYEGAIRYSGTFGINPLLYSQRMKQVLLENGVQVYESSEVTKVDGHTAYTHMGSVTADEIIFCADKLDSQLTGYSRNVYHAQTFLAMSEPLERRDIESLFPAGPMQCWDSSLIYTYFRLTGGDRLLVGGGDVWTTYSKADTTSPRVIERVIESLKAKIPAIRHLKFIQYWPGRIDMTRDLLPTVLRDGSSPWIHFVLGCVGLPWATFCGDFVARHVLGGASAGSDDEDRYYRYFSPNRRFLMPLTMEGILGKRMVFTLNNAWAKYRQIDIDASPAPVPERW